MSPEPNAYGLHVAACFTVLVLFLPVPVQAEPVCAEGQTFENGITVDCDADDHVGIDIAASGTAYGPGDFYLWPDEPRGLLVFNAGVIEASDTALTLMANSVTYHGVNSGALVAANTGLHITSLNGDTTAFIDHDIEAASGLFVTSGSFQRIDVDLTGEIRASQVGILLDAHGEQGQVAVTIGPGGAIIMDPEGENTSAFRIVSDVPTTISLAGKVLGPNQVSKLGVHGDTLELLPGYTFEGSVLADEGEFDDTLLLSGTEAQPHLVSVPDILGPYQEFETLRIGTHATLQGAGNLRGVFDTIDVLGTLAPRAFSAGSLVAERAVFQASSILEIELGSETDPAPLVLQSVKILGGTVRILNTTIDAGSYALILLENQGEIAPGTFTSIQYADAAHFDADIVYNAGQITLVFTRREEEPDPLPDPDPEPDPDPDPTPDPDPGTDPDPGPSDPDPGPTDPDPGTDPGPGPDPGPAPEPDTKPDPAPSPEPGVQPPPAKPAALSFAAFARTPEQMAVAAILDAMGADAPYAAQFAAMDPAQRTAFLEQLAGAGFAATNGALLQSSATLNAASLQRIQQLSSGLGPSYAVLGYSAFASGSNWRDGLNPNLWGRIIAGQSNIGASSGSVALLGGADVELGDGWTLGLLAGIGATSFSVGNTTGKSMDLSAGFYGAKEFGNLSLRFGGSLIHHSIQTTRTVTVLGVVDRFDAAYGALTGQLFAEAALAFELGPVNLELFGDVGYARNFTAAFTETGGAGALSVAASSSDAVESLLGVRASHQVALGTQLLETGVTVGLKHRFMAAPSTMNSLAGGTPFAVAGTSIGGSALALGADLRLDIDRSRKLELTYGLEWGGSGAAHSISLRYVQLLF